ncbi:hypothetical protein TSOC_001010 [Tetrabaena socialis]|uniref:CCD97-like C-terminal domain-containing protein n=1 Tax=Tetrabaena socialis TaxID=47790 RepID=A0A2J8AHW1_9CHLO|nr:hypothetical protein TSOC_001010 [Tetrabaena socialis]|eukprot:PNH12108.1 hypothetical protein TSOC_001010 [Tetrabaena socialis]
MRAPGELQGQLEPLFNLTRQTQELNHFEALRSTDYEVDHWMRHFMTQRLVAADTAANPRRLPARVKNRRLAHMRRLAAEGEYFSDEQMRHRAPLLYHQQERGTDHEMPCSSSGAEQQGAGGAAAAAVGGALGQRGGLLYSEFILRQNDEALLVMRRLQEQKEEDEQLSENEDDDEGEDTSEEADSVVRAGAPAGRRPKQPSSPPSAAEIAQLRRDFVTEMHSRFLLGLDAEHVDYSEVDADVSLDADWLEQESRDAEDKYFDED